jgi:cytochrome c peroxidase
MMIRSVVCVGFVVFLAACSPAPQPPQAETKAEPAKPIGQPVDIKAPLGLPPVPVPSGNPVTADAVALGRKLYYDTKLSADNSVSCATCHDPNLGFTDGRPVSAGINGQTGGRSAPTVINSAYNSLQFWDGRAASLEEQAAGPVANPIEMGNTHEAMVKMLDLDPSYHPMFEKVFGPGPATIEKATMAIASFERTVLSGNSPFDKYMYGPDAHAKKAMSAAAIRGLAIYKDPAKGNCAVCHSLGERDALFTDNKFHNLGVGVNAKGELKDKGRSVISKNEADEGAFKTPTLRNIAQTAPYMHDGGEKTLKQVIDFYVGGGNSNPHLDKEMKALKLTARDRTDLEAFLNALTGELPADTGAPAK